MSEDVGDFLWFVAGIAVLILSCGSAVVAVVWFAKLAGLP